MVGTDSATGVELLGDRLNPNPIAIAPMSKLPATKAPIINGFRPLSLGITGFLATGTVWGGEGLLMGAAGGLPRWGKPPGATATVAICESAA